INACDRFIYTEIFRTRGVASDNSKAEAKSNPLRDVKSDQTLKAALDQSIDAAIKEETGRANLAEVGAHLYKLLPDFDPRNYGFKQLSDVIRQLPTMALVREQRAGAPSVVYVERKQG
ncbi:MAG: OST-HTH/LOTUS domain-containing protein, partial [Alphaproteobacteria bacterium]|nr:OST-HTH/LOTUS domain-containing protein [Alphaproteobacteria bacterium]